MGRITVTARIVSVYFLGKGSCTGSESFSPSEFRLGIILLYVPTNELALMRNPIW